MILHRPMRMSRPAAPLLPLLTLLALMVTPLARAALTGIADEPLITQAEFKPKPNMMVILDDSGSMGRDYLPDDAPTNSQLGYNAAQCNGLAYNPAYTYTPPVNSTGVAYSNANFNAALSDGYDSGSSTIDFRTDTTQYQNLFTNTAGTTPYLRVQMASTRPGTGVKTFTITSLSSVLLGAKSFIVGDAILFQYQTGNTNEYMRGTIQSWNATTGALTVNVTASAGSSSRTSWYVSHPGRVYYTYRGSVPAADRKWTYNADGSMIQTTFYNECFVSRTANNTAANAGVFELNTISANSTAAEKTNYANWYSYYRLRRLLMRTAMGQALSPLDENYRIGFMTINKQGAAGNSSSTFRPVNDFNTTQKSDFYSSLYTVTGTSVTPLRAALSHAGRYFAKNLSSQRTDPMQYACQRNYSLLTTDGYWNETFSNGGLGNAAINDSDGDGASTYEANDTTRSTTLADVAHYYYNTDLRTSALGNCTGAPVGSNPGQDVCANIVTGTDADPATHQHMATFTIGLGIVGTLPQGTLPSSWPSQIRNDSITTADDLWHASVNGHGSHYSAQNASQLTTAIQGIVTAIQDETGAGSATATSTLDLVQGDDNLAFEASYTTGSWYGDVVARRLDAQTAEPDNGAPEWSAREQLNAKSAASRNIYFKNGNALSQFTWDNLSNALRANFTNLCSSPAKLTQCASLSSTLQGTVNNGAELVAYLRGDATHEMTSTASPLFRERKAKLGDIVNSKPIHVGAPPFDYIDTGYAEFKASHQTRKKVVYVGANDGMLHALDASTGEELWAYIPTAVMSNLYRLADVKYGSNSSQPHTYYVDGKTVQGDVKINGQWRTILVGGLNKGGRAYYALDITDPDAPSSLWEFAHSDGTAQNNLGYSYSDPIISKLANGTWTVAFSSGYNNVSPGDGKARLFVVSASDGSILRNIVTTAGDTTTPAGMAKINVWVTALNDNTAQRFYGGDLLGNLWRFSLTGSGSSMLLAQMKDASGTAQPITTEPKLREYDKQPIVVVATGRYLGRDDIDDTQVQSIAAIRDPLTSTGWGVVRTNTDKFQEVTITKSGSAGSGQGVTMDWANDGGWWADFPVGGERVALPMEWDGARLLAATTLPDGNQCKSGGASWLYSFSLAGGKTTAEQFSEDALIVGFSVVRNQDGDPKILVRTSDNKTVVKDGTGLGAVTNLKPARRISWRELQ